MSTGASPDAIRIRPLGAADVEAVVAIESEAFTTPWQADTFASLLERPNVELIVMEHASDGVIGYAVLWCILDQGELANLALSPLRRGAGLGRRLLDHVLTRARERGVEKLFLEVRASNRAALELYGRAGFQDVGVRRDYYEDPREDARIMVAVLD